MGAIAPVPPLFPLQNLSTKVQSDKIMYKNQLGYRCFPPEALKQVMGEKVVGTEIGVQKISEIHERLQTKFNIDIFETGKEFSGKMVFPDLLGGSIEEHFEFIANELITDFEDIINDNLYQQPAKISSEERLSGVLGKLKPGWNRIQFYQDKFYLKYTDGILEDFVVFDTETFVKGSEFASPIIGTGINQKAFYIWLHPALLDGTIPYEPMLIDLGKNVRVVVGHNVGAYDRPRTRQAYTIEPYHMINEKSSVQEIFWLDTMAMHQVVAGICEDQMWAYLKDWTNVEEYQKPRFMKYGTKKSLVDVYNFHCGGKLETADKELRNIFVNANTLDEIRDSFLSLLYYAIKDVNYTFKLFQAVYPKYRQQCPSPVTFASHHLLSNTVIPVNNDWHKWKYDVENYCQQLENEAQDIIEKWIDLVYEETDYSDRQQDIWWKFLPELKPEYGEVGIKTDTCHYLFKMVWNGHPVLKDPQMKWSYVDDMGLRQRLPHRLPKTGEDNVGNVFNEFYFQYIEGGIFGSAVKSMQKDFNRLIEIQHLLGYWISTRTRILNQPTMLLPHYASGSCHLLLGLGVNPHNTISSRIGQELWLTVAAHNGAKPAAELKYKTNPPDGYKIVNFDFSQQELNVLAAYGDSYIGVSGSTALGNMTLVGDKKMKNDVASKIGELAGVSRQHGKQGMYATCYGAGAKKLHLTLRISMEKAQALQESFKGKSTKNSRYYFGGIASESFNKMLDIISLDTPQLPMLGTWMQPALTPKVWGKTGAPGQLNFTVQASGTSILQATAVAVTWLVKKFNIDARFIFSLHDELIFVCKEEETDVLMYLIEIAHVWVWAFLHYKLGINDMPVARAFVPVNRDVIWRKEAVGEGSKTSTPTFSNIPPGEEIMIENLTSPTLTDKIEQIAKQNQILYKKVGL